MARGSAIGDPGLDRADADLPVRLAGPRRSTHRLLPGQHQRRLRSSAAPLAWCRGRRSAVARRTAGVRQRRGHGQLRREPDRRRPGDHQLGQRAIFSTSNQGINWQVDRPTLDGSYVSALAFGAPDPNGPDGIGGLNNFLYAGTVDGNIFVTQTGGGSTGGGNAWTNISTGLDGSPVVEIVTDPTRGQPRRLRRHPEGRLLHGGLDRRQRQLGQHHRQPVQPPDQRLQQPRLRQQRAALPHVDPGRLAVRHPERFHQFRPNRHAPGPLRLGRRGRLYLAGPGPNVAAVPEHRAQRLSGRRRLSAERGGQ